MTRMDNQILDNTDIEPIHITLPGDLKIVCSITRDVTIALRVITSDTNKAYSILTDFCQFKGVKGDVLITRDDIAYLNAYVDKSEH